MGYLANFIVYTLAMVGVMGLALFAFKKFTLGGGKSGNARCLKVLDTMSLSPRKTLYIVSAGSEKFLIAGDVDRTTLISKLGETSEPLSQTPSTRVKADSDVDLLFSSKDRNLSSFKETMQSLNAKTRYADKSIVGITSSQNSPYTSVMRSLAERIKE